MTNEQAKFILRAYRSGGQDAADPAFAEVLSQASRDPILRAWLEKEQAFDGVIGEKLRAVAPPVGLRESILAGAKASRPTPRIRRASTWMAMAASVVVAFGAFWAMPKAVSASTSVDELARFALGELSMPGHPRGQPLAELGAFGAWLGNASNKLGEGLPIKLEELRANNCRVVTVAGREVFEICFRRDVWYHVYIARRADFGCQEAEYSPMYREQGELASCTWVDDDHVYVLVSRAGLDAVKRAL
jgi:hypothetical protein